MIRIAITHAAYNSICATLPLGSVAVEPYYNERGERRLAGGGLGQQARRDARTGREYQRRHSQAGGSMK
jgi:hypothetical protein